MILKHWRKVEISFACSWLCVIFNMVKKKQYAFGSTWALCVRKAVSIARVFGEEKKNVHCCGDSELRVHLLTDVGSRLKVPIPSLEDSSLIEIFHMLRCASSIFQLCLRWSQGACCLSRIALQGQTSLETSFSHWPWRPVLWRVNLLFCPLLRS